MPDFSRISADEAKKLIDDENAVVADVRDERSFEMGHIPTAKHVENTTVQQFIDSVEDDTPVIVCCFHGHMSQSAAAYFAQQGLKKVYSLDGGYGGWSMLFPDQIER